jgi:hypothetical protein
MVIVAETVADVAAVCCAEGSSVVKQVTESSINTAGYEFSTHQDRHGESLLPTVPVMDLIQNARPVQHLAAGFSFNSIHPLVECVQSLRQHVAATRQQLSSTYDQANHGGTNGYEFGPAD